MALLKGAHYYQVGATRFPAYPVDEKYITQLLEDPGFVDITTHSSPAEHNQGYAGMIFFDRNKEMGLG